MGIELSVVGGAPTPGLAERWRASLAAHGLLCEFHPDFAFGAWSGGFLPIKLSVVPGSFPAAERYGAESVVSGFEISEHPYHPDDPLPDPPELAERLRRASHRYQFRTAAGRSVGELRLQCLGSATLSELVDGAVYDPQQGEFFFGPSALANAMREADDYEANWAEPHQWQMPRFAGFVPTQDDRVVPMDSSPIHNDPDILGGTAVFIGTRVPFQTLLEYLEDGESLDRFLEDFPTVTREQAVQGVQLAERSSLFTSRSHPGSQDRGRSSMSESDPAPSTPPAFGRSAAVVVALMMSGLVLSGLMAYHLLRRPWPPAPPEVARDPLLSRGRAIFLMRCSTCHGYEGRGDGPLSTTIAKPPVANLTDAEWKHGDRPEKVLAVIENGVPNTRMDSWRQVLGPPEVRAVAAYVYYLARRPVPEELRKPG